MVFVWERRLTRMLAVCCAVSFAASLVEPARNHLVSRGGKATPR